MIVPLMIWKKDIMPMNDYRITLTQRAVEDIKDIGDYIAFILLQPHISKNFIKGLKNSISHLKLFPYKFPLVQDDYLQSQGIRCMPFKNFYIFYKVIEDVPTVVILRVGYNKRNWKNILT